MCRTKHPVLRVSSKRNPRGRRPRLLARYARSNGSLRRLVSWPTLCVAELAAVSRRFLDYGEIESDASDQGRRKRGKSSRANFRLSNDIRGFLARAWPCVLSVLRAVAAPRFRWRSPASRRLAADAADARMVGSNARTWYAILARVIAYVLRRRSSRPRSRFARTKPATCTTYSVAVDPRTPMSWRHPDWRGRPWEETVLYELHWRFVRRIPRRHA